MILINHCENSHQIGDKKQLFYHLQRYCKIRGINKHTMIPTTVHLSERDIEEIKSNNSNEQIYSYLSDLEA